MSWRVARALDVLLGEINAAAPNRSKISDGSIGDAAHASRESDHNPWVIDSDGVGVVRARDYTHDPAGGLDCNDLAVHLAGLLGEHPALRSGAYVIWNRRIISRDRISEGWRPYTGSNPHDHHLHLSVGLDQAGYDSRAPWGWGEDKEDDMFSDEDRADLKATRQAAADAGAAVAELARETRKRDRRNGQTIRKAIRENKRDVLEAIADTLDPDGADDA